MLIVKGFFEVFPDFFSQSDTPGRVFEFFGQIDDFSVFGALDKSCFFSIAVSSGNLSKALPGFLCELNLPFWRCSFSSLSAQQKGTASSQHPFVAGDQSHLFLNARVSASSVRQVQYDIFPASN
ncbi:hypothetical protein MR798_09015 [bacterium]|nr:hypothetical protein [bacterium]